MDQEDPKTTAAETAAAVDNAAEAKNIDPASETSEKTEAAAETAAPETEADNPPTGEAPEGEEPQSDAAKEPETPAEPDWKDRFARAMADFDNFRKRTARDREDLVKFAASDMIKDILPTVDNLALALDKAKDNAEDPFVAGIKLVYDGLLKALADHGATPLDSVGEPFDANFHEALAQLPSPEVDEGIVMNEVKRGWLLHGKLLRAAQVVVSSGKPNA